MKGFLKILMGLFFIFSLTGCFGETYDFSPPTVSVFTPNGINEQEELAEANIDWNYDKKYNKETKDILSLAKKQNKMYFNSWQRVEISIENGDFNPNGISVSVWQKENNIDLEYQKNDQKLTTASPYIHVWGKVVFLFYLYFLEQMFLFWLC